jgi:hypothetical protein
MGVQIGIKLLGLSTSVSMLSLLLSSSALLLASQRDFESMAKSLSDSGRKATSPALLTGKSGVAHEFAFAVKSEEGKTKFVVDAELSVKEVNEMKVLAFFVKVFDVSPEHSILCVSPHLSDRASALAKEYHITVLQNDAPRKLVGMAAEAVEKILKSG